MKPTYSLNVKVKNPNKILSQTKVNQSQLGINKLELTNNSSAGKT